MSDCFAYVIARDFGFAPNPFHGRCTLATCKPQIRHRAHAGDWVVGMGGAGIRAEGKCLYAMKVYGALTFDEYWHDLRFRAKRPVRNGSSKMLVGDNIYHRDAVGGDWIQEDSHHSNTDGSPNQYNLLHDTATDRVLFSEHFYYFGEAAPDVPSAILVQLGYRNIRGYRRYTEDAARPLIEWLEATYKGERNYIIGDPFQFARSSDRYSISTNSTSSG